MIGEIVLSPNNNPEDPLFARLEREKAIANYKPQKVFLTSNKGVPSLVIKTLSYSNGYLSNIRYIPVAGATADLN